MVADVKTPPTNVNGVMMKVVSKHHIIHLPSKKHTRTKQTLLKHFSQFLFGQGKQQALTGTELS